MEWTVEQQGAIDAVLDWHKTAGGDNIVFRLFGYAGTGKTTIAKAIAESINGQVIFSAFTGKAALVLNSKGCYGARTIHSLIYIPRERCAEALSEIRLAMESEKDEDRIRELQAEFAAESENLKRPAFNINRESDLCDASLLILDEVSMVDEFIAKDLMSFGIPILCLGDPAQLPPVRGSGYFINEEPDYMLEQIHRQAKDSPILDMATAVRAGRSLGYREEGDARVVEKGTLGVDELSKFDQIICGRNATRKTVNRHIRTKVMKVDSPLPVPGDRIICLRNDQEAGLLNGSQWDINAVDDCPYDEDKLVLTIAAAGDGEAYTFQVTAHKQYFLGTEDEIPHYDVKTAQCFDYAYAITAHKSQGSQWPRVVVINESNCFRQDSAKWLYTAITRAADELVVIQ